MRTAALGTSVGLHAGAFALTLLTWPFLHKPIEPRPEPVAVELIGPVSSTLPSADTEPEPTEALPETTAALADLPEVADIDTQLPDVADEPKVTEDPLPTEVEAQLKPLPKTAETVEAKNLPQPQDKPSSGFDLDQIASAIGQETSPHPRGPIGSTLSATEIDALRAKMQRCWNPDCGAAKAETFEVQVRVYLNRDGSLLRPAEIVGTPKTSAWRAAAERAVRAVDRCAPYVLPQNAYSNWKDIIMRFDPQDVCT